jgi:hypothetical protein
LEKLELSSRVHKASKVPKEGHSDGVSDLRVVGRLPVVKKIVEGEVEWLASISEIRLS